VASVLTLISLLLMKETKGVDYTGVAGVENDAVA
jgi:hypothetical protein